MENEAIISTLKVTSKNKQIKKKPKLNYLPGTLNILNSKASNIKKSQLTDIKIITDVQQSFVM